MITVQSALNDLFGTPGHQNSLRGSSKVELEDNFMAQKNGYKIQGIDPNTAAGQWVQTTVAPATRLSPVLQQWRRWLASHHT